MNMPWQEGQLNISQENLTNIAFTPEISFTLSPYEEKEINFKLLETTEFSLPIDLGTVNKIEFNCLGNDEYLLINDNYKQDIKNVVMFAPKTTRTNQLAGWITSWEYPFLVGKFLYVSGFDNKYFFVGNSELLNDVPSLFNTKIIKSFDIYFPKLKNGGLYFIEDLFYSSKRDIWREFFMKLQNISILLQKFTL